MQHLLTFADVCDVLGTFDHIADITEVSRATVSGWWTSKGLFPAQAYKRIRGELNRYGCDCDDGVFDFIGCRLRPNKKPRPRWTEAQRQRILKRRNRKKR